jgi:hypothetical protein
MADETLSENLALYLSSLQLEQIPGDVVDARRPTAIVGSGHYVMAVAALRRKIDADSFENEFLRSEQARNPIAGDVCAEEVITPKGESGNPPPGAEVEAKFLSLAVPILGVNAALVIPSPVYECEKKSAGG